MANEIEALVAALAREMQQAAGSTAAPQTPKAAAPKQGYTVTDYPMLQKHGEEIRTPTGKTMREITLENVLNGSVNIKDVRISKEMLHAQAQIAADAGKPAMGENLKRAAELTQVPDDVVIQMYDRLRPNRSTKAQLEEMAATLENTYGAAMCAQLVREAAQVYEIRGILLK